MVLLGDINLLSGSGCTGLLAGDWPISREDRMSNYTTAELDRIQFEPSSGAAGGEGCYHIKLQLTLLTK